MSYPFEILPTISGFEIIDSETGHPVDTAETGQSAAGKLMGWRTYGGRGLGRATPRDPRPAEITALLRNNRH